MRVLGKKRGASGGPTKESIVDSVAVQDAALVPELAVGVHVTGVESATDPLINCTVPVGPTPLLFVAIVAVSVTEVLVVTPVEGAATTVVEVAAFVTVRVSATGPAAL